jgi:hypothetical protein
MFVGKDNRHAALICCISHATIIARHAGPQVDRLFQK